MESAAARQGDRLVLVGLPDGSALSASHTAETTATPAPSVYVRRCERANWHLAPSPAMPDIEIAEMPRTLPDPQIPRRGAALAAPCAPFHCSGTLMTTDTFVLCLVMEACWSLWASAGARDAVDVSRGERHQLSWWGCAQMHKTNVRRPSPDQ
jgi:hypothetical protein